MKYLITSTGGVTGSKADIRFGRSNWFCIKDSECKQVQFIENEFRDLNGGAGMKAAEMAAEASAGKVVSGDFGPKAKALPERFTIGIIVIDGPDQKAGEIIASLTP